MKKKTISLLLVAAMLMGLVFGCGKSPSKETQAETAVVTQAETAGSQDYQTRIVVDGMGTEVEIPEEITSYVVTAGPYSQVVWALDGGNSERLIGQMVNMVAPNNQGFFEKYDPNFMTSLTPAIGPSGMGVNVEELVAMHPDVAFLWNTETAEIEQFRAAGVPTIVIDAAAASTEDIIVQAEMMARVLGPEAEARAAKIRQYYGDTIAMLEENTKSLKDEDRPGALYLQTSQLSIGAAGGSFTNMYEAAGGTNVASQATGEGAMMYWQTVDMEQILAWNPDVIYLSHFDGFTPEDLYENKIEGQDWSQVEAVKNHRVYKEPLDSQMWVINYVQLPLYQEYIAKTLQPELYQDVDLIKDTQDFYKEIYNIDLSEEEASAFFLTEMNGMELESLR